MNPIALFFGFAMLFSAIVFVVSPFRLKGLNKKTNWYPSRLGASSINAKESVLLALRDLDFDYQAGKVADEDYLSLRASLIREAAGLFEVQENSKDQVIEALIQSRRKDRAMRQQIGRNEELSSHLCRHCKAVLSDDAKFCSKCGKVVEETFCHNCGRPVQPGVRFCPKCGVGVIPSTSIQQGKGV